MNVQWIEFAKRLQAIAQAGLSYSTNKFELERYEEVRKISIEMMSTYADMNMDKVSDLFANETGYQTPKVDIRAAVFRGDKVLMVKEESDGCWSIPGGWADIGYSPAENAVKEVREEAGLEVKPVRLLAVLDMKKYSHPPAPYDIYKLIILCEFTGGVLSPGLETSEAGFFAEHELPLLSVRRITAEQMRIIFEFQREPQKAVVFD
jgi:ADP-ribose pyrophosphatase YjhB (NUDIX family)